MTIGDKSDKPGAIGKLGNSRSWLLIIFTLFFFYGIGWLFEFVYKYIALLHTLAVPNISRIDDPDGIIKVAGFLLSKHVFTITLILLGVFLILAYTGLRRFLQSTPFRFYVAICVLFLFSFPLGREGFIAFGNDIAALQSGNFGVLWSIYSWGMFSLIISISLFLILRFALRHEILEALRLAPLFNDELRIADLQIHAHKYLKKERKIKRQHQRDTSKFKWFIIRSMFWLNRDQATALKRYYEEPLHMLGLAKYYVNAGKDTSMDDSNSKNHSGGEPFRRVVIPDRYDHNEIESLLAKYEIEESLLITFTKGLVKRFYATQHYKNLQKLLELRQIRVKIIGEDAEVYKAEKNYGRIDIRTSTEEEREIADYHRAKKDSVKAEQEYQEQVEKPLKQKDDLSPEPSEDEKSNFRVAQARRQREEKAQIEKANFEIEHRLNRDKAKVEDEDRNYYRGQLRQMIDDKAKDDDEIDKRSGLSEFEKDQSKKAYHAIFMDGLDKFIERLKQVDE